MVTSRTAPFMRHQPKPRNVPDYLIYEIMDGKPIYYKGYKDVLSGKKQLEEIMGCSSIQSFIVTYLATFIWSKLGDELFTVLSNEAGVHLNHRNNLAGDILVFENEKAKGLKFNKKYVNIPAQVVIEVDITAEAPDLTEYGYVLKKTKKLLDFGVEKVIWISTTTQSISVATADGKWTVNDWHIPVEVYNGVIFNLGEYLDKRGIVIEE